MKILNNIIMFFLIQCFGLNTYAQELPIKITTKTGDIYGTLLLPEIKNKIPIVLIISGSGPTDRDGNNPTMINNSLKFLAESLKNNGIASVRFDKRGIAASKSAGLEEINLRFENYISDVNVWIDSLYNDKRFSKIIVLGHSEGSLIGMIASVKNNKVNAFISVAGAGRTADELIKEQLKTQPQFLKDTMFVMIDKLKSGDTIANISPLLYSLFRPSIQPYMISWFKYNPQTEIAKLEVPILIIQGTTDIQIKELDAELLHKSQPKAELRIIKNMNHILKNCETISKKAQTPIYNNPELPINKELEDIIKIFIEKIK